MVNNLSSLPSVDQILRTRAAAEIVAEFGRPLTLDSIRYVLDGLRALVTSGDTLPNRENILALVKERLEAWLKPTLIPVINATGVILHTNLGRAPLSQESLRAVQNISSGYSTLEYDLESGERGTRFSHVESLLTHLTGAESAFVVNNNAAAVLLILSALPRNKNVIISRTQLIEIGGGFRIPDILRQSGAHLVEIGATNRVNLQDYELALREPAALVLRAHHSNFKIIGFTSEPDLIDVVTMSRQFNLSVVDDQGSGTLIDTGRFGLAHEPTVQESLAAGVDVVCFSGDKLLGGPQAGIIVGRKDLLAKMKRHPLSRALRADKLCLAALAATLFHYLKDEVERKIPIWQMIATTTEQIQARANHWCEVIGTGEVINGFSTVGGGSLPEETLPTFLLALNVRQPNKFLTRLRHVNPPVIARIETEKVVFDPRTVLPEQEGALLVGIQNVLGVNKKA